MADLVTIAHRFRGPPQSANGGYACGVVARRIESPLAEVTLKLPPPLEREMALGRKDDGSVELRDADSVVAEGRPLDSLDLDPPDPVSLAEAEAARESSPLHGYHPWPMCFVCGPDRGRRDGLRVISGIVESRNLVASPWETDDSLPAENGVLAPEVVWAALDCPSGNALMQASGHQVVAALGRLSARIDGELRPGETYVAVGCRAVWIELKGEMLGAASFV